VLSHAMHSRRACARGGVRTEARFWQARGARPQSLAEVGRIDQRPASRARVSALLAVGQEDAGCGHARGGVHTVVREHPPVSSGIWGGIRNQECAGNLSSSRTDPVGRPFGCRYFVQGKRRTLDSCSQFNIRQRRLATITNAVTNLSGHVAKRVGRHAYFALWSIVQNLVRHHLSANYFLRLKYL
jgi:hypothetical protein